MGAGDAPSDPSGTSVGRPAGGTGGVRMGQDELGTGPGQRSLTLPSPEGTTGPGLLRDEPAAPEPRRPVLDPRPRATRPPRPLVQVLLCEDQEVFRLGLRSVLE